MRQACTRAGLQISLSTGRSRHCTPVGARLPTRPRNSITYRTRGRLQETRCSSNTEAAVDGSQINDKDTIQRSVLNEVVQLGVPVLGAALSEPLLTLVDTWCLGQTDGTLALAALSVNCGLFNFLSNSGAFLVTATTNCIASALAVSSQSTGESSGQPSGASLLLGNALVLATMLGAATAAVLWLAPSWVLSMFGAAPGSEMASTARSYLAIRAFSAPSLFLMFVAVGAALGAGNAAAPAVGIALAAVVNLIGDGLLVLVLRTGLAGAAAATAAASWIGTATVLHVVRTRVVAPVFQRPTWAGVAPLLRVSLALLTTQVVSSVVYSYTTAFAAASGAVTAAGHQVVLQLWWLLSYAPVPLYLAAQSLLGHSLAVDDRPRAQGAITVLCGLGAALSGILAFATWLCCTHASGAFSSDPAVAAAIKSAIPAACVAQALGTGVTTVEGIFAGAGRLRYVASVALLSAPAGILAMRALLARASTNAWLGGDLAAVWWGLVFGEAVRLGVHFATWGAFARDVREGKARGAVPPSE